MGDAASLVFGRFREDTDPLAVLLATHPTDQLAYLTCYLHDLEATGVVVEPNYFDRDYLSEYAAFYCTSTAGHSNLCRRVHYFSEEVTRDTFVEAAGEYAVGGASRVVARLQRAYLGHVVVRPLKSAPLGRTVVRLYPDAKPETPRLMHPARTYHAHVAGITLTVTGIAWQQQDTAVGACATVALWSMLHSSAFDDHHAIPTTAEITALAHKIAPTGRRVFPAVDGLDTWQMLEVIKAYGLAPVCVRADAERYDDEGRPSEGFSRARFCTLIASFLRAGYPVLVNGMAETAERDAHSVCLVGFRSPMLPDVGDRECETADTNVEYVYVHDDNLGPNVRLKIVDNGDTTELHPEAPEPRNGAWPANNPTERALHFTPTELVVAVHQELRTAPLQLQRKSIEVSKWLPSQLGYELESKGEDERSGMLVSSAFFRLWRYAEHELARLLSQKPPRVLAGARLQLWEEVGPLSLHIGVVRVTRGVQPVMDVLFDTSDSDRHLEPVAYVAFQEYVPFLAAGWERRAAAPLRLGKMIQAW